MQLQTSIILLFFILIVTRPGVAFSRGDSFDAVFEELLKEYRDDVSNPQTFHLLRKMSSQGTDAEIQSALLQVLDDPSRIGVWGTALLLASNFKTPSRELLEWARTNLDLIAERTPLGNFGLIENILVKGDDVADAERLRSIGARLPEPQAERAAKIRKTADSVVAGIEFLREFRKKAAEVNQHGSPTKPEVSLPPTDSLEKTTGESPPLASGESHPWLVWMAVVISALGLMWLSVKKRRSISHSRKGS